MPHLQNDLRKNYFILLTSGIGKDFWSGLVLLPLILLLCNTEIFAGSNSDNNFVSRFSMIQQPVEKSIPTVHLIYGFSMGSYFANSSTANYYNGSGEHSVATALNRQHYRDMLIRNVDEIIETFQIGELPLRMRYSPAIQVGFFGGFEFRNQFGIIAEFNYARFNIADKFTIYTDKFTSTSEPYILLSDIYGREERIDLRLGVQFTHMTSSYMHPFIESGLSITDTKVLENMVMIQGMEFNIREIRVDYYGVRDYGMGFGIYTTVGVNMEISDNVSFRAGGSVNFSQINLGDNNRISPQFTAFIRLNLHDLFAGN